MYLRYKQAVEKDLPPGPIVELGSGKGHAQQTIPHLITSEYTQETHVNLVMDGRHLPFADESLSGLLMLNVFHHIPNVDLFLSEAQRCLKPGGMVFIIDQHPGLFSYYIYRFLHNEDFTHHSPEWAFQATGPFSANGALAWMVFNRDREKFHQMYTQLSLAQYLPHTPLLYWLSGGLKRWTLLPGKTHKLATLADKILMRLSTNLGSFVDIKIIKNSEEIKC